MNNSEFYLSIGYSYQKFQLTGDKISYPFLSNQINVTVYKKLFFNV